jgi:hypothetical protein
MAPTVIVMLVLLLVDRVAVLMLLTNAALPEHRLAVSPGPPVAVSVNVTSSSWDSMTKSELDRFSRVLPRYERRSGQIDGLTREQSASRPLEGQPAPASPAASPAK